MHPPDFDQLQPFLKPFELKQHVTLFEANRAVDGVYFVERGMISRLARTQSDGLVEVAAVGRSGFVGLSVVLGTMKALHRCVVQAPGLALRICATDLQDIVARNPAIREHLLGYVQLLVREQAQVALCSAKHAVNKRLGRWLLSARNCIEHDEIPVTHDRLAMLLGTHRSGISLMLDELEAASVLSKSRGALTILDADELKRRTCGCHKVIEESFSSFHSAARYANKVPS